MTSDDDDPSDADNPPEPSQVLRGEAAGGTSGRTGIEVEIAPPAAGAPPIDVTWLRRNLLAAASHVERPIGRVAVTIVGDGRMRALNETHRGVADTTDVLAFETAADPVEADIVLCADEAVRRATELGHAVERELLLYALHGLLHCAGFDDQTHHDFEAMHAEEDRILEAIGVGPTFAREQVASRRPPRERVRDRGSVS